RVERCTERTRELRERQRTDLEQTQAALAELNVQIGRDERQLEAVRAELTQLAPQREPAQHEEQSTAAAREACERELAAWQQRWEHHTGARGAAEQSAQVE